MKKSPRLECYYQLFLSVPLAHSYIFEHRWSVYQRFPWSRIISQRPAKKLISSFALSRQGQEFRRRGDCALSSIRYQLPCYLRAEAGKVMRQKRREKLGTGPLCGDLCTG